MKSWDVSGLVISVWSCCEWVLLFELFLDFHDLNCSLVDRIRSDRVNLLELDPYPYPFQTKVKLYYTFLQKISIYFQKYWKVSHLLVWRWRETLLQWMQQKKIPIFQIWIGSKTMPIYHTLLTFRIPPKTNSERLHVRLWMCSGWSLIRGWQRRTWWTTTIPVDWTLFWNRCTSR